MNASDCWLNEGLLQKACGALCLTMVIVFQACGDAKSSKALDNDVSSEASPVIDETSLDKPLFQFENWRGPGKELHVLCEENLGWPCGLEESRENGKLKDAGTGPMRLGRTTPRRVLSRIMRRYPGHRWVIRNGVLNVEPQKSDRTNPLDKEIKELSFKRTSSIEAAMTVLHWADITFECKGDNPYGFVDLELRNITARDALNAIVKADGQAMWVLRQIRNTPGNLKWEFEMPSRRSLVEASRPRFGELWPPVAELVDIPLSDFRDWRKGPSAYFTLCSEYLKRPCGLEKAPPNAFGRNAKWSLNLQDTTPRKILDEIAHRTPGYRWAIRDGVVNMEPKRSLGDGPLSRKIDHLWIRGESSFQAALAVLHQANIPVSLFHIGPIQTFGNIFVELRNVSVRDALNAIVKADGQAMWSINCPQFGKERGVANFSMMSWRESGRDPLTK
jgi:hypothetical protein